MSHLERALRDLEVATAALGESSGEDNIEKVRAALAQRSKAIARLSELKDSVLAFPPEKQAETVQRMRYASGAGELAQLRLAGAKRKAMAEWRQWKRIHQALAAGGRPDAKKVDCSG